MKNLILGFAFISSSALATGVHLSMACAPVKFSPGIETRTKIAVIDTGVTMDAWSTPYICKDSWSAVSNSADISDSDAHGTNIAGIISRAIDPKKQCLLVVKWFDAKELGTASAEISAVQYAIDHGAKVINMSLSGEVPDKHEFQVIKKALDKGIYVSVSAGNSHHDLDKACDAFPACYSSYYHSNFFAVIGSKSRWGGLSNFSNYGKIITTNETGEAVEGWGYLMSGTSQATAVYTQKLVRTLFK